MESAADGHRRVCKLLKGVVIARLMLGAPLGVAADDALGGFQTVAAEARRYAFPRGPLRHAPVHLRRSRRGVNSCATDEPRTTSRVSAELSPAAVRNAVLGMRGRCAGSRATSRSAAKPASRGSSIKGEAAHFAGFIGLGASGTRAGP